MVVVLVAVEVDVELPETRADPVTEDRADDTAEDTAELRALPVATRPVVVKVVPVAVVAVTVDNEVAVPTTPVASAVRVDR